MKKSSKRIKKYATGGVMGLDALDSLDSVTTGPTTGNPKPTDPAPAKKPATPKALTPAQLLKQKYNTNPYLVGQNNRYYWATQTDREFPLSGGNVKDAISAAAKYNKVDPALLYASAMEEGMSGAIDSKNWENASEAYVQWSEKNPKLAEQFPVDSFYNYGLDQFAGQIPGLVKKGYLPTGFEKNVQSFDAYNEKDEKIKAAAFNTDANALMAKSAMMRLAQDQLNSYAGSRGYKLTPEQQEFFLLANYNGGQGNMQKMLDSYNAQGYLKNNDFLNTDFTPSNYAGIYKNVQARIQAARMLRGEHVFKYGGTIPEKPYAKGGKVDPEKPGKKGTSKVSPPLVMPEEGNVSPGLIMPFTDQSGQEGTIFPNGAIGKVSPALVMPEATSSVSPGLIMPTEDGKGFMLPNGETVYGRGKVGLAPIMPTGSVDEGFVMPFSAGGDEGTIYPNGATSKVSIPFPMPEGRVGEAPPVPITANSKLRGVRQYAEGGKIEETGPGDEAPKYSDQENYYRSSAKLAHYKTLLNDKLKAKNPQAFGEFFKGLQPLRQAGNQKAAADYIQNSQYNDYLSNTEVKKTLGKDYEDYLEAIQQVNAFDVAQGRQPLYGTQETGMDVNSLNYGRRFASLALTPSYSGYNKTRGTSYNRSYTYDPKTKQVSFTESGDQKLRPDYLSVSPTVFKKGGKMPKYPDGGPIDPFTPTGVVSGQNNWLNTNDGTVPINPDGTPAIPLQNQAGTPVNQGRITPLSQFYDVVNGPNGNQMMQATGQYVNAQGQTTNSGEQQMVADQVSAQNRLTADSRERKMNDVEMVASTSMAAINAFFQRNNAAQQDRSNRRKSIQQTMLAQMNPYLEGTGSQAIFENGGSINIKPENRGKFTAAAKRAGMGVQAYASKILANPENYSSTLRKRANFAKNASKWNHGENGLSLDGDTQDMQILDGGNAEMLSGSDHSNPMIQFNGRTHDEGGIGLQYGGNLAEVEDKEVGWIGQDGSLNIFGKLKLPGTGQTFRKAAQDIAKQENKIDGEKSKYLNILNHSNPADPYQESALSTSKVMFKSLDKQSKQIAQKKEALASYQNLILGMVEQGQKMKYGGQLPTMPTMPKFEDGGSIGPGDDEEVARIAKAIAEFESGSNYNSIGVPVTKGQYKGQRALGKYQIMEDNAKQWYKEMTGKEITTADFIKDPKIQDQVAQFAMKRIYKDHPNPADVASIWFTGQPTSNKKAMNRKDDIGTSGNTYVKSVVDIYNRNNPNTPYKYTSSNAANVAGGATNYNAPAMVTTKDIMAGYTPINNPVPGNQQPNVQTKYGAAKRDATPFSDKAVITSGGRERGYQSPLDMEQIAPELISLATNQRQAVGALSYQPDLQQTFDISYQLGRNENESTFRQSAAIAEQTGNMDVLAQLAAQKYKADQQYNMQEIQSNAQQRLGTYAQNIATLNDAKLKNLALISDQSAKQAQADYNTRLQDMQAIKSIAAKVEQNKLENKTYNAYANLFQNYGFDNKGNVTFDPGKVQKKFTSGEAQAFGMMAAQQGANSILNGDFSRQFTKVKNSDGSTTTTETLGTNKKIQEEYNALKKQGFDDSLIGNILQAKYPQTISGD